MAHDAKHPHPDPREHDRPSVDDRPENPAKRGNPPHTTTGEVTAPKFGSAGSGGAENEPIRELDKN